MNRILLVLVLFALPAVAATLNSDGSASDTQTQITAASNGDKVLLPASGSYTWSASVSMPSTKYITLDLNGRTITLSGASGEFSIAAHATGNNIVTNGSIVKSGTSYADYSAPFKILDARGSAAVRVGYINFSMTGVSSSADAVMVDANGQGPGVVDHCSFTSMGWADEFMHINGWGAGVTTGWTSDSGSTLAGGSILYFENCTFTNSASQSGVAWVQGYYGARAGFRYCTFDHISVDMHGTPGNVGARWWEFYMNTWCNTVGGSGSSPAMNMRAGSGVCWSNTATGSGYTKQIQMCEEDSGYPADYQIGRGLNQTSDFACIWYNTSITAAGDACDAPEVAGMVAEGRDYTNAVRASYSAYTYPHPLVGGSGGGGSSGSRIVNIGTLRITNP